MLHASEIIVRRGGKRILDEISISVIGGELVALLGPSGAGKSTLLATLCGDLRPSAGHVWMAGRPMAEWSLRERALRRAVLPQVQTLSFPLSALDVVLMGRAPHITMTASSQDAAIAHAALQWVQAEHLSARLYPTLSGGERQQVQLARVLAQVWGRTGRGDCYVFLDEPTTGLDPAHQHRTLAVARQLATEGAAVVMVLHDLNLAAQYADRLLLLRAGLLAAEGPPAEVLQEDVVRHVFGIEALVTQHPVLDCPLVVPTAALHMPQRPIA